MSPSRETTGKARTAPRLEVSRLRDELARAMNGSPWHGNSLLSQLEGITYRQAAAHPIAGAHSIWELVIHLASWARECARRVSDGVARDPERGDWPKVPAPSAAAWKDAVRELVDAHEMLLRSLDSIDDGRLDEPVREARKGSAPVTHYLLLHGCSQHYAYHSGQIALLVRALATSAGTIS